MTQREFQLAKKAAASMLAAAMLASSTERDKPKPLKPSKKSTGYAKALQAKFAAANAAYESRKAAGATLAGIEREYGLKPCSLNNWRSYRMRKNTGAIQRTYVNRPLKNEA